MSLWTLRCIYLFESWFLFFYFFLGVYPGVKLPGYMVVLFLGFVFFFWQNLCTVFHSDCTTSHSYKQYRRVPFPPYPHRLLLFVFFLIVGVLTGARWFLIVVLIFSWLIEPYPLNRYCLLHINYTSKMDKRKSSPGDSCNLWFTLWWENGFNSV